MQQTPVSPQLSDRLSAHCATLSPLPDGGLLCGWYAGAYEMATDVAILAARWDRQRWTPPRVIAVVAGHSLGQPVFLPRGDGELWLFFNVIMGSHWRSAQPFWQKSFDGGQTWQPPVQLLDRPGLMFRSKPLLLDGRILLPVYDERAVWQSRMMLSDDGGQSWRLTAPIRTPPGNIQPSVIQRADGVLLAYLRTGGEGGFIWRTESGDGGETWRTAEPTALPNPNAGIDLLRLDSGMLVLAYNNSAQARTPLCVALAGEDESWRWVQTVAEGEGEYSYPVLAQTTDGQIHLAYTHRRTHIQHAVFDEARLKT